MNLMTYSHINMHVSSEMFYSLMACLHEKLPCAKNYFRMRKKFREQQDYKGYMSPVRAMASPKMIRGLSIPKA